MIIFSKKTHTLTKGDNIYELLVTLLKLTQIFKDEFSFYSPMGTMESFVAHKNDVVFKENFNSHNGNKLKDKSRFSML